MFSNEHMHVRINWPSLKGNLVLVFLKLNWKAFIIHSHYRF